MYLKYTYTYIYIYIYIYIYYLLFDYPRGNFGLLSRGQPHSPNVNLCVIRVSTRWPPEAVGFLSPVKHLAGFKPGTFGFYSQRLNSIGDYQSFISYLVSVASGAIMRETEVMRVNKQFMIMTIKYLRKTFFRTSLCTETFLKQ